MNARHRPEPVAIIGGGIAGLTAAHALRHHGIPFRLFEASDRLAGLARSFRDDEGFSHDFGAHFITNRLAAGLGMGAECRTVHHYGEVVRLAGEDVSYPLGLLGVPRFDVSAVWTRLRDAVRSTPAPADAAAWFRHNYGGALADEVALPLLEAWSGQPADRLAPAVGEKLPGGLLETLWLKLAGRLTDRAVAIGYCGALPQSASVWHVYPEHGVGSICARLAEGLDDAVSLGTRVQRIHVEGERAVSVRANDQDVPVSAVISTAPIHILPRLVEGSDALERFARFRFRPMILANLNLEGRHLLSDTVVWLPEQRFASYRVTEAPTSMPWLAPEGKTTLTVDIGCEVGDDWWTASDEAIAERCLKDIAPLVPDAAARYLGHRVLRTPIGYPIFLREYEADRLRLALDGTGVDNLLTVGRNGAFDHLLMEDVYCRTLAQVQPLIDELLPAVRAA